MNYEISSIISKNVGEKLNKSNNIKSIDIPQSTEKQEKIDEKELYNSKNLNKEDSFNKKDNINDDLQTVNSKEKNIITINLTNDEKIVFSQLGINPLIKLGKEYLVSNNFVHLQENSSEKEKTLNKKTTAKQVKKISKSKAAENNALNIDSDINSKDKSIQKTNESEEILFLDKNDEIELTDEINNARKKRRRSSASIE